MKKIIIIIILLMTISLKSQSVVIDITNSGAGQPTNYYRKDINNLLSQFQGTYVFTNGNIIFKVVLKKIIMAQNGSHYDDLIIGEYQYIENGIEKINTLSNLNITYSNEFIKHAIAGSSIIPSNTFIWTCNQCNTSEKVLRTYLLDKISDRRADFLMRRIVINGQEVLQVKIQNVIGKPVNVNNPEPPQPAFVLPISEFTMIKQ